MNFCTRNARPAPEQMQKLAIHIARLEKTRPMPVVESDTENACATHSEMIVRGRLVTGPVIAYNPQFLAVANFYNEWAVAGILAHEIAHHSRLHLHQNRDSISSSHQAELEADTHAGMILRRLGAPRQRAYSIYDNLGFDASGTHPGLVKRRNALANGWDKADRQLRRQNEGKQFLEGVVIISLVFIGITALARVFR